MSGLKIIWVKNTLALSSYRKHFDYFINVLGKKINLFLETMFLQT